MLKLAILGGAVLCVGGYVDDGMIAAGGAVLVAVCLMAWIRLRKGDRV